ncbi:MAG TPA: hypothetical protein VFI46_17785 [Jiangellaceae bacterium]|nr:hypothetical protein [Jiangellaceae bacterium]
MTEITPEQRAEWRRRLEDGTAGWISPVNALALMDALDAAEAREAEVLAFLRQPQLLLMPGRFPVTHSEGCWAWHTECLAVEVRRMLGDER